MPDPKKPLKAPLAQKYAGAEKVTYDPTKKGYKKQETIGTKTYYDKASDKAISGGLPGADWEKSIIKKLESGVSPEELVKAGHIDPSASEKYRQYYKPVFTEQTTVEPKTTVTQPYAGTRSAMRLEPKTTATQPWDTYTVPDLSGQVNKSSTIMVDPKTGNVIDETKYMQTGDFSKSLAGKTLDEYRSSNVRSDAQGSTNMLNTINGLPVVNQLDTKIMKPIGDKQGNVASSTGGGFKKGGLIKGYALGGGIDPNEFNTYKPANQAVTGLASTGLNAVVPGAGTAVGIGVNAKDAITSNLAQVDETTGKFKNKNNAYGAGLIDAAFKATPMGMAQTLLDSDKSIKEKALSIGTFGISDLIQSKKNTDKMESDNTKLFSDKQQAELDAQKKAEQQLSLSKQLFDREQGLKNGGLVDRNAALQKKTLGFKDGGKIEGKGSGTSDSITAKVKPNSFVVPAKNSAKAEAIRKVVLKAPNGKANLKQSNGAKVKLSNGEHLFTPKEVEKIENILGDDILDKLAPNSAKAEDVMEGEKNEMELKKGGSTPGQKKSSVTTNKQVVEPDDLYKGRDPEISSDLSQDKTPPSGGEGKKFGLGDLSGIAENAIPFLQAGYGLSQLKKMGKRPVGELDKDYLKSINQAQSNVELANAQAKYGFTPEEQALLNSENQNITNAESFQARNLSGGSAGNAYNMQRGASNNAFNRALKAKVANRDLMLQKQNIAQDKQTYLDDLVANKANMSRTLFNDKINAFNINQQAGAGLLGAGLQNIIGSKRYKDELAAMKETQGIRNSTYNSIG